MTYLNKVTKTKIKPCLCSELPNIEQENLDVGTRWECDGCGRIWQIIYNINHFPFKKLCWENISGKP